MSKIEPETKTDRTNGQWPEGKGEGDNGEKMEKGLVKERV